MCRRQDGLESSTDGHGRRSSPRMAGEFDRKQGGSVVDLDIKMAEIAASLCLSRHSVEIVRRQAGHCARRAVCAGTDRCIVDDTVEIPRLADRGEIV